MTFDKCAFWQCKFVRGCWWVEGIWGWNFSWQEAGSPALSFDPYSLLQAKKCISFQKSMPVFFMQINYWTDLWICIHKNSKRPGEVCVFGDLILCQQNTLLCGLRKTLGLFQWFLYMQVVNSITAFSALWIHGLKENQSIYASKYIYK